MDKSKDTKTPVLKKVKKSKKQVSLGRIHVLSTPNNTKLTITDLSGNVLCWSSCGTVGFKGSKKSTAYAASKAAEDLASKAQKYGLQEVYANMNGFGQGRLAALKSLRGMGIKVSQLSDITPVAHGGVKRRKQRKV